MFKCAKALYCLLMLFVLGASTSHSEVLISQKSHSFSMAKVNKEINALVAKIRKENRDNQKKVHLYTPLTLESIQDELPIGQTISQFQSHINEPIKLDLNEFTLNELNLNLNKAIGLGLSQNLDRKIAINLEKDAKWKEINTYSRFLPNLVANYDYVYRDGNNAFFSTNTGSPLLSRDNYVNQAALVETVSIKDFFNVLNARSQWKALSSNEKSQKQLLILDSAIKYYDALLGRAELAIQISSLNQAKKNLELNKMLTKGGLGTKFSVI